MRLLFFGVLVSISPLHPAGAEIFGYQDKNGFWHFPAPNSKEKHRFDERPSPKELEAFFQAYQQTIRKASKVFGVDSRLIRAVIKAESDYNHRAISKSGALGLMQLMPETAKEMEVKNPFNPTENIMGGTRYLAALLKRFDNNKPLALAAFNAGPERVEACGRVPAIIQTRKYVDRVLFYYEKTGERAE